jgi:hypothetical protein
VDAARIAVPAMSYGASGALVPPPLEPFVRRVTPLGALFETPGREPEVVHFQQGRQRH